MFKGLKLKIVILIGACFLLSTRPVFAAVIIRPSLYIGVTIKSSLTQTKINSSQNVTGGSLDSGLVGLWSFNGPDINWTSATAGTALDRSGSGNTGTLTNMSRTTSPTIGKLGQALSFDGADDVVTVPYNASAFNFSSSNFTISAWVYINSQTTQSIWGSSDVFSNIEFSLVDQGPYNMALWNGAEWQYSPTSVSTGWHHLTVVRTGSNGVSWYLDGNADGSDTFTNSTWGNGTQTRWIGDGFRGNLNGKIDELRIYNRALSAIEIQDIYNDTGFVPSPTPTPETTPISTPPDTTLPSTPQNISAYVISSTQINLSWSASSDNIGVVGYYIYRNGSQIATTNNTNYSDTGLSPSASYSYTISAYDAAGNSSSQSSPVSATTQALTLPPSNNIKEVGAGQAYNTIQACITAAVSGDICNVHSGTYGGFTINKNNITVKVNAGDTVNITGTINVGSSSNVTIDGFNVSGFTNYGIYQLGGSGLTIKNNIVHNGSGEGIYSRNSTKLSIVNNKSYANSGTGIVIISGHSTDNTYTNGIILSGNEVYNNGVDGVEIHGQYITVNNNFIYDNIATNWASTHPDGIQLIAGTADGYTAVQNVIISNNTIRNHTQNIFSEGTVSGQSSDTRNIWIFNNVVYNDSGAVNGVSMDSIAASNAVVKYSRDVHIYNNYFGRAGNLSIYVQDCYDGSIHIKNNIIVNNQNYGIFFTNPTDIVAGELNYNLYYTSGSAIIWGSVFYPNLTAFKLAVPAQEVNGLSGDPQTAILPTPSLNSGSLAINMGANLTSFGMSSLNIDKANISRPSTGSWDIGAYEYLSASSGSTAHTITASSGIGGSISPSGSVSITNGGSQTFTIVPSIGYSVSSIMVDGVSQGAITTYTFNNVTANHTISATFTANQPVLGDFNLDHVVNTLDFSLLNSRWLQNYPPYDLFVDGLINSLDFAIFSSNWGKVW